MLSEGRCQNRKNVQFSKYYSIYKKKCMLSLVLTVSNEKQKPDMEISPFFCVYFDTFPELGINARNSHFIHLLDFYRHDICLCPHKKSSHPLLWLGTRGTDLNLQDKDPSYFIFRNALHKAIHKCKRNDGNYQLFLTVKFRIRMICTELWILLIIANELNSVWWQIGNNLNMWIWILNERLNQITEIS